MATVQYDLTDFNTHFEAQVQWVIDNFAWHSNLEDADKARFATALVLNNYNVHIYDGAGNIFKIVNP